MPLRCLFSSQVDSLLWVANKCLSIQIQNWNNNHLLIKINKNSFRVKDHLKSMLLTHLSCREVQVVKIVTLLLLEQMLQLSKLRVRYFKEFMNLKRSIKMSIIIISMTWLIILHQHLYHKLVHLTGDMKIIIMLI